jgi:hypothetical protein
MRPIPPETMFEIGAATLGQHEPRVKRADLIGTSGYATAAKGLIMAETLFTHQTNTGQASNPRTLIPGSSAILVSSKEGTGSRTGSTEAL